MDHVLDMYITDGDLGRKKGHLHYPYPSSLICLPRHVMPVQPPSERTSHHSPPFTSSCAQSSREKSFANKKNINPISVPQLDIISHPHSEGSRLLCCPIRRSLHAMERTRRERFCAHEHFKVNRVAHRSPKLLCHPDAEGWPVNKEPIFLESAYVRAELEEEPVHMCIGRPAGSTNAATVIYLPTEVIRRESFPFYRFGFGGR